MPRRFPLLLLVAALGASFLLCAAAGAAEPEHTLRYDSPASTWTEALPIGNGRIGAMVFGGTSEERVQINESTLWGGRPHEYTNPEAGSHLAELRQLIFAGRSGEAAALAERVMGRPKLLMPYQPFCDLRLRFPSPSQPEAYRRELRLDDAVATTTYVVDGIELRREVFASYPDQVLVVRLTASQPKRLTFDIGIDSPQQGTHVETEGTIGLLLTGQLLPRENPPSTWTGSWDEPGLRFAAVARVLHDGGTVRAADGRLEVADASAVTILFSNATSFRNYRDIDGDAVTAARGYVDRAAASPYDELRRRHVADFQSLFSRVQLQLGETASTETTDRRITSFAQTDDPSLLALYFHFGRYLLISSSRPGGQPANLQGIWNEELRPAWGSKWTTNINLEMNYWLADAGNLWETQEPLWRLVRDLRVSGADTARVHYGAKGWVLHHNTDLWRATTPVDGPWGLWPMGSLWLANQMWDHYEFSLDREFLAREAYPAMKGAAEFALDLLVPAPAGTRAAGRLVTNPSTSPENNFLVQGKGESLTYAASMDLQLVSELFERCQRAASILGVDADFARRLKEAGTRLPPLQIGARGQLQEWIEDYAEAEPAHRHVSHLYALYPGQGIDIHRTPALAAAAKRSLELRGDGGTGWAAAWRVALWARLGDGERAYANLRFLLTKSTLPNMFDLHPPFQIDGNLGGAAGITELLVQSTLDEIRLVPALPKRWATGRITGVLTRGGATVDLSWKGGTLTEARLHSDHARRYRVTCKGRSADVALAAGVPVVLDSTLHVIRPVRGTRAAASQKKGSPPP
jgi:alpha-L-fucosidase 2